MANGTEADLMTFTIPEQGPSTAELSQEISSGFKSEDSKESPP